MRWSFAPASTFRASIVVMTLAHVLAGCASAGAPKAMEPGAARESSMAGQAYPASEQAPQAYPAAPHDVAKPSAPPPPPAGAPMPVNPVVSPVAQAPVATQPAEPQGTEHYQDHGVNPVVDTSRDRLSTFAVDVDTASYSIGRRMLNGGTLPPFASVRVEEYVNYFRYGYAPPAQKPFAVYTDAAPSPFAAGHHLLRVGLQGKKISAQERVPVHLVYLVDTSGSMQGQDRMELAKKSLKILTDKLVKGDTVAICTYAGGVQKLLDPTGVENKEAIMSAIDRLRAGGSTAMGDGLALAYDLAKKTLVRGHVSRVVVLSDGDANVGRTSQQELKKIIAGHRGEGITLSTVGYGSGNYKDALMEALADSGDGNYTYIDSEEQARRVFGEQTNGLLQVIARDVKIQVELDPSVVRTYRLVGYENRDIKDRDFRNDKVDAGEVGAGHTVTAVYDVVLTRTDKSPVTVRVRHKAPRGGEQAEESVFPMSTSSIAPSFEAASSDFRFAAAVVGFAEVLRKSPHAAETRFDTLARIASNASEGRAERLELVGLVAKAAQLSGQRVDLGTVGVGVAK